MFPSLYVPRYLCSPVLCSPVSVFPSLYVPRFYAPRSLCSPVLCSPVPMFPNPYVPQYLCSPISMFPRTYILRVFFFGGGGGRKGVLEQFVDKIGRLASFFKMVATATLEDLFCSLSTEGGVRYHFSNDISHENVISVFYPPPDKVGAGVGLCPSGCPFCCSAVCLSVRFSIPEQICGWISLILHTHIP